MGDDRWNGLSGVGGPLFPSPPTRKRCARPEKGVYPSYTPAKDPWRVRSGFRASS